MSLRIWWLHNRRRFWPDIARGRALTLLAMDSWGIRRRWYERIPWIGDHFFRERGLQMVAARMGLVRRRGKTAQFVFSVEARGAVGFTFPDFALRGGIRLRRALTRIRRGARMAGEPQDHHKETAMATNLSDADRQTLQDKVAKLVTDQQAADAADAANTAAQSNLSAATSAASAASSALSSANAAVLADEQDLEAFVESLVTAQTGGGTSPTPTPAPST